MIKLSINRTLSHSIKSLRFVSSLTTRQTTVPAQAPNAGTTWSENQRPKQEAMTGPRFEQTDFDLQVRFSLQ
jgi:hypothetical protein